MWVSIKVGQIRSCAFGVGKHQHGAVWRELWIIVSLGQLVSSCHDTTWGKVCPLEVQSVEGLGQRRYHFRGVNLRL